MCQVGVDRTGWNFPDALLKIKHIYYNLIYWSAKE